MKIWEVGYNLAQCSPKNGFLLTALEVHRICTVNLDSILFYHYKCGGFDSSLAHSVGQSAQ